LELDTKVQAKENILKEKVSEYSCIQKDETVIKVGPELIWLWVVIELESKEIPGTNSSKEQNMFVAERFLYSITDKHDQHPVSTDGSGMWYPSQACRFLKLKHHLHLLTRKALLKEQNAVHKGYDQRMF
jgi:putative transposase